MNTKTKSPALEAANAALRQAESKRMLAEAKMNRVREEVASAALRASPEYRAKVDEYMLANEGVQLALAARGDVLRSEKANG